MLSDAIGACPDEAKLKECWLAWLARGYRRDNWAWALEWYKSGIPKNGNGNGHKSNGTLQGQDAFDYLISQGEKGGH